ncbi:MAG: FtsX-like permease family protein, partial [Vicinamibacterales bacterium]
RLVLRDALRICALGLALGVGAGWALGRWLESVQYGVTFFDPLTWTAVALLVSIVTIVACWSPARLAMRTSPVTLLRD